MTFVVVMAVCVGLLLAAEWAQRGAAIAGAKLAASSCFVAAAVAWGALGSDFGRWIALGLVLSWVGDALLLPRGRELWLRLGIGAFGLGHVAYAIAFARAGLDAGVASLAFVGVAVAGALLLRWLGPHLAREMRWPVRVYVLVIGVMVVTALAASARDVPWVAALGAVGFAVSDVSVARDRFVTAGFGNSLWGLPLYFGSQLLLAYGASLA